MRPYSIIRRVAFAALAGTSILTVAPLLPNNFGMSDAAQAQPAELGDIHLALEPYGMWQNDQRWGEVWVPFDKGADWRPYTIGHWIYTDDWGWYWISDEDEQDWGWITFHYGRWARSRDLGWFWIPGEEWAPAWVNWRDSEQAVGWAPLPPDDVIDQYDDDPVYWTFVSPRFFVEPEPYRHYYGLGEREGFMRSTIVVNRSLSAGGGRRFGINPGVSPGRIAAFNHAPVQAFQVRPHVLAGTQGIANAVPIQRSQFAHRGGGAGGPQGGGQGGPGGQRGPRPSSSIAAVSVQRTNATIAPAANLRPQQPLGKGERGRLGGRPPRAAQGGGASPATAPATAPSGRPGAPATTPAPVTTPATPPTTPPGGPRPNGERPSRAIAPQTPPGARPSRAAPNTPLRPATAAPVQPPRPAAPAPQRPKPPKPPVARPAGPPPAAARPVAPRPAVAAPPAARPAPAVARPPAARPAPPPARPAPKPAPKPAAKPGAKPQDVR